MILWLELVPYPENKQHEIKWMPFIAASLTKGLLSFVIPCYIIARHYIRCFGMLHVRLV